MGNHFQMADMTMPQKMLSLVWVLVIPNWWSLNDDTLNRKSFLQRYFEQSLNLSTLWRRCVQSHSETSSRAWCPSCRAGFYFNKHLWRKLQKARPFHKSKLFSIFVKRSNFLEQMNKNVWMISGFRGFPSSRKFRVPVCQSASSIKSFIASTKIAFISFHCVSVSILSHTGPYKITSLYSTLFQVAAK